MEDNAVQLIEIKGQLDRLCTGIESVKEKQEEMLEDVAKIREAVYNPDQGLYARIRALETWKSTSSRMIWTLFTTTVGIIGAIVLKSVGGS